MQNVHANIINSLAKVIESAQPGYPPKSLLSGTPIEAQSHSLTLTVLSAKNDHILLEEQISGKKLLIDKSALQGTNNTQLVRGDSLVLVTSNNKFATFIVQKNSQQNPNKLNGQPLQNVSHSLSLQWPDIPVNVIKKTQPLILNQLQLATNTQQAKNLANSIISIASKTGQPIVALSTTGSAVFIGKNHNIIDETKSVATGLRLNIDVSHRQSLALTIGLTSKLPLEVVTELKNKLSNKQTLNISLDVNSNSQVLTNIKSTGQNPINISALAIKEINNALRAQFQQIKQRLTPLVLSPQSTNLQMGIAIAPTEQNLHDLGPVIKQQITQGISKYALQNTRVLLGQSPQNHNKIQISLIDKPVTIAILNSQLAEAKFNDSAFSSNSARKVNTEASVFIRSGTAMFNEGATNKHNGGLTSVGKFTSDGFQQSQDNAKLSTEIPVNKRALATAEQVGAANHQPSKALHNKLIEMLTQQGNSMSATTIKVANLQSAIYREMNQLLGHAENMGKALPSLLSELKTIEKGAGPELKHLIAQVSVQIKNHLPARESVAGLIPLEFADTLKEIGLSPDNRQIKEILTTPTFPNINAAPIQAISGVNTQSGLINGLITMLQASLQAKLISQQPQLLSALLQSTLFTQMIPKIIGHSKMKGTPSKILQDLNKLDPKSNLIGGLNKVLSNHSLHKLIASESTLQNQDSFYYTLPNMFSPQHKDIEIVIKREQLAQREKDQKIQQAWQLSMKLDIGDSGEVLAKVKLLNENLDLNLYASNQKLKEKILDNLPFLNRRLVSLGLSVKPQCFLGKIPNTLHKTAYQVVQTYV